MSAHDDALVARLRNEFPRQLDWDAADAIERLTLALAAAEQRAEKYWPYVEAVAKKRYPFTATDEVDAAEMLRERKRAARSREGSK
jgi:tRNA(Met) C34 N-acetyltransferase TmcA